ncbi:hypothetical protein CK203_116101 [Vitis vinifera]|uniref:Uncharacterized protein n=1 Tax=Vitis vinifera TaxID=29760 RepID=A0A438CV21_VITVI|nr:hypothetical protein CK203_116101 [Vitis vinifera]
MGCANLEGVVRNFRTSLEQLSSKAISSSFSSKSKLTSGSAPKVRKKTAAAVLYFLHSVFLFSIVLSLHTLNDFDKGLWSSKAWPIHLDDEIGNPDPRFVAHAQEFGVNVERVLSKEVHSESFRKDTEDSFHTTLNSHQKVDSRSASHNSRPSVVGTFASGYDGLRGGTDDGGTQFSDSSNEANIYPPHVMSYVQPSSSTNEEYGMPSYSPSTRMSYQVSYHME